MPRDNNGKEIKIGDRVKRICGGEHYGVDHGDIVTVIGFTPTKRTFYCDKSNRPTASYEPNNFIIINQKKSYLPEWL